jgi:hypothetical protein
MFGDLTHLRDPEAAGLHHQTVVVPRRGNYSLPVELQEGQVSVWRFEVDNLEVTFDAQFESANTEFGRGTVKESVVPASQVRSTQQGYFKARTAGTLVLGWNNKNGILSERKVSFTVDVGSDSILLQVGGHNHPVLSDTDPGL